MSLSRFIAPLICLFLATTLDAATIAPGTPGQCQLRLSGPVETGDAETLIAQMDAFSLADGETSDQFLCLSSPGGSFAEAIKLGKILIDKGIGTRIEAGQSCLSACAVVFMMGSQYFYEGVGNGQNANRHMHVTARLGFHRPELKLATEQVFDTAAVEQSFDIAIQATLEFVRIANEGSRTATMVPPDLIEAMFTRKGADFFYIETTGQTARWDIDVDGLDLPKVMTPEGAWNACVNIPVWKTRYDPDIPPFDARQVRVVTQHEYGTIYEVRGPYESDAPHYCLFQYSGGDVGLGALNGCGLLGRENQIIGEALCTGPEAAGTLSYITSDQRVFLPPDTRLTEAHEVAERMAAQGQGAAGGALDAFRAGCANNTGRAVITNVRKFTNLRSAATIGGDKVEEVALNAGVEIIQHGAQPDLEGISPQCRDLCLRASGSALSQAEENRLNACFDANAFWYRVRTGSGRVGYLSGKFLRY